MVAFAAGHAAGSARPAATADGDVAAYSVKHVTSSDIEQQAASLREWDQVYEQMTPGRFVGELHELCFAGVQLFREATNQAVHESGAPWKGLRAVGVPVRSAGTARFRGQAVDTSAVVTLGSRDELDFYTPREFEIIGLVVDESALDAHACNVEHQPLDVPIAGRGVLRPGAGRVEALRGLLASIVKSLEVNPAAFQYRQTQRVLEQTLLGSIVAVLAGDEPSAKPAASGAGRQQVVDAAKAYMRSRIAEPITVADLCRELGVSRRTLQYAFQEALGTNAVAFLRAMRLNGVRRDLRSAQGCPATVQDTAARWGFWHLGHFVTDYKRMFGELPSQTLQGNRRSRAASVRR